MTFQHRYLALVAEIERRFRVSQWRLGDVDIWPLARMESLLGTLKELDRAVKSQPFEESLL